MHGFSGPLTESGLFWFAVSAAVPLAFSVSRINRDLWYDEAYTVGSFAAQPIGTIVTSYPAPNNHILFTVLLRPFYLLSDSEISLRLLPLLCALGTLTCVFALARRLGGTPAAVCATAVSGLNQVFLNYTMQVRGYTLSMLLCPLIVMIAGSRPPGDGSKLRTTAIVLCGSAFLYVLPSNVLFLAPIAAASVLCAWLTTRRPIAVARECFPWVLALVVAAACYFPVWQDLVRAGSNRRATPDVALWTGAEFIAATARDQMPLLLAVPGGLAVLLRRAARTRPSLLLTAMPIVAAIPLATVSGVAPFARTYTPVVPLLGIALGWCLTMTVSIVLQFAGRASPARVATVGLALVMLVSLPRLTTFETRLTSYVRSGLREDPYYVYTAGRFRPSAVAAFIAGRARARERYICCFTNADQSNLGYYLTRYNVPYRSAGAPSDRWTVYVIAGANPDYATIAAKHGLTTELLQSFPLAIDTGYFRVFQSPVPIPVPSL